MYDFINDLPSWLRSAGEVGFSLTTIGAIAVILLALLVTRRWQVVLACRRGGRRGVVGRDRAARPSSTRTPCARRPGSGAATRSRSTRSCS